MRLTATIGFFAASVLVAATGSAVAADLDHGEQIFKRCAVCHTLEPGKAKLGPPLFGVFGREAGTVEGFRYSKAMKEADVVWSEETIDKYIADPRGFIKGNRMAFPGLKDAKDRADLIAYLKANTQ